MGGVEVVNCELNLLKCATENKHYRYYHLLSVMICQLKHKILYINGLTKTREIMFRFIDL
mgnify:CR=1 FL=1